MSQPPYVTPLPTPSQFPSGLSLRQFLQTVFVGVSGLAGPFVRPRWQPEPPKQPDIATNWMSIGLQTSSPDASAYLDVDPSNRVNTLRYEDLLVQTSFYGPDDLENYGILRDGFQLPQNRISLYQANMAFVEITQALRTPDLVNQRWIDRVECTVRFRRQVQRTYPVLTFVSASGIIYVPDVSEGYEIDFQVTPEED